MIPVYRRIQNQHLLYDPALLDGVGPAFFDPEEWRRRGAVFGGAEGRATVLFIAHGGHRLVLRHFRRGGALSHFISDRYLWRGLKQSRAWREWHLLHRMHEAGLPVPRPVAARVERRGWRYRADLITLFLPDCASLASRLKTGPVPKVLWTAVGRTIRRFHDAGYCHADLNAHNILIQSQTEGREVLYFVDFDRGEQRHDRPAWKNANLKRLRRSVFKLAKTAPASAFSEDSWRACLDGYHGLGTLGP